MKQQFKSYLQQHQVTHFIFFPSPIILLFHKYTPHHDIASPTLITPRTHPHTQNILPIFPNTLLYPPPPHHQNTSHQLMPHMKQICLRPYQHQQYPFQTLLNHLLHQTHPSHNPLFHLILLLQNNQTNHANFPHTQFTHIPPHSTTPKFHFSFIIQQH
ncbi:condensation domain-containing protein, partial [Staphylococcus epidermidis]|uniref:condensation domain-containing protein n=1 Tax=Staphylococcus epidermidis TaxID=1282 RepID=UPI00119E9C5F